MRLAIVFNLIAVFLLASTTAFAVEVDFKGTYEFAVKWMDNVDFADSEQDGMSEDDFGARQQLRLQMDFIASEQLRGVFFVESGETVWGGNSVGSVGEGSGGAIGSDGISLEVRRAYVEFLVPNTELTFRVGIQGFTLPATGLGDPILGGGGTDMAGIVASLPVNDMISLTAGWFRPIDEQGDIAADSPENDEMDVFALALPMSFEGVSVSPYVMLGLLGKDVEDSPMWQSAAGNGDEDATLWWMGSSFEISAFDPLSIAFDLVYGNTSGDSEAEDRSGWLFQGEIAYDLGYMTPSVALWYSTGDDDDSGNGSETMPAIDPGFYATTFGFDGSGVLSGGDVVSFTAQGTMGAALILADISFVEDLSHTFRLAYIQGTHDEDAVRDGFVIEETASLSSEDTAWEVNFDHCYQIFDELAFIVEMGYVSVDLDEEVRGDSETSDAWKLACQLTYEF